MKIRISTWLLLAAVAPPAFAGEAPASAAASPSMGEMVQMLKKSLTEEETALLYQYMKDSVFAAFGGDEVAMDPELAFKLEILAQRVKKIGGFYMDNLVKQLEDDVKRSMKEYWDSSPTPAPESPAAPKTEPVASGSSLFSLPSVSLPSVSLPSVSLPSVSLPSVSLPSVSLPEFLSAQTPAVVPPPAAPTPPPASWLPSFSLPQFLTLQPAPQPPQAAAAPVAPLPQQGIFIPLPWFYPPQPNYSVPMYTPPPAPWFTPPPNNN